MLFDPEACYRAVRSRDRRFDGRFFTAVASTGIYCRPICPVRPPKRENMRFYSSAAAAEGAGYRPCLRCRPERAPGLASVDAASRLVGAAIAGIEEHAVANGRVADLAASLGVTDRHLRRVTEAELGVSPVELAQTQRLLLAKRLLGETSLKLTDIAFASGFGSVRRFNALFKSRYGLNPREPAAHGSSRARADLPARLPAAARVGGACSPTCGCGRFPVSSRSMRRIIGAPWRSAMLRAGSACRSRRAASRSMSRCRPRSRRSSAR